MQRLSDLAASLGTTLHGADGTWQGASLDTRQLTAGNLFFALPGQQVDGHDFLRKAASLGAAAAVVNRVQDFDLPQLPVPDVAAALLQLATHWRRHWAGRIVAVTGSNGKTTVKNLLASILRQRGPTFATQGNLNNHLGVPLSLLNIAAEQRDAVLEMGANHAGEIALLTACAQPQLGLVTQAADAHLEGFGSRDGVAQAKGELFAGLPAGGHAVINADDAYCADWQRRASHCEITLFGRSAQAVVRASQERARADGCDFVLQLAGVETAVKLALPGPHNVMNALGAAAAAQAMGCDIAQISAGLAAAQPAAGRLQLEVLAGGLTLIDDSYNANPASVMAAIHFLSSCDGPRHLVLGDMAELGSGAERAHRQIGGVVREQGLDGLWTCGPLSRLAAETCGATARAFTDQAALWAALAPLCGQPGTILVKGSRSAAMDRIAQRLRAGG